MSYASEILKPSPQSVYFCIMNPRYLAEGSEWVDADPPGAMFWKIYFPRGTPQLIKIGDGPVTPVICNSAAEAQATYLGVYFDQETKYFYFNYGADISTYQTTFIYQINIASLDCNWLSDPLDSASGDIHWPGLLANIPATQSNTSDQILGVMPSYSSTVSVINRDSFMYQHSYNVSFNKTAIEIYHCVGSLDAANTKLILRGSVNFVSINDELMSISFIDQTYRLDDDCVVVGSTSVDERLNTTLFPNLDPSKIGSPARSILGRRDGVIPINVDYDQVGSTTTNRKYVVRRGLSSTRVLATVLASPVSTNFRIYFSYTAGSAGFQVGDTFSVATSMGLGWARITNIQTTSAPFYFDCTDLDPASIGKVPSSGASIANHYVSAVYLFKAGVRYELFYGKHYTHYAGSSGISGFQLVNNVESLLTPTPSAITPFDQITCRVYGDNYSPTTIGGSHSVPSTYLAASPYGVLTNGVIAIYLMLKDLLYSETFGDPDSLINYQSFIDLYPSINQAIGISFPNTSVEEFQSYRQIISKLALSLLIKLYIDENGKWAISAIGPLGATSVTASDLHIKKETMANDYDYGDLASSAVVSYAENELNYDGKMGSKSTTTATASTAKRLHGVSKSKSFASSLIDSADASVLAARLSYMFGDQINKTKIVLPIEFFDTSLDDVVKIQRDGIPGYEFDLGTNRDRKYSVTSTKRGIDTIELELTDQKGIEDNAGSW